MRLLLSSSKAWDPWKQNQVKTTELVICRSAMTSVAHSCPVLQSPSLWQSPWALHTGFPGILAMGVQQSWTTGRRWKVHGRQSQVIDIFIRCWQLVLKEACTHLSCHHCTEKCPFLYAPTSASLKKNVNWSIVDLQYVLVSGDSAKWFSYTQIYPFSYCFPLWLVTGYWI